MSSIKERMAELIQEQPEDATYEEIMRELAFQRMISRGLEDSRAGRVVPNDEMARRIRILGVFHGALEIERYLP